MLAITPRALRLIRNYQTRAEEQIRRETTEAREGSRRLRTLGKARHDRLVQWTADLLRRGISSKFEYEAACRTGLRKGLCLEGWKWLDADTAAAVVVLTALNQIGAVRPTWYEGQPEYTQPGYAPVERVQCERCGTRIPDGRFERSDPSQVKFCSTLCREAAKMARRRQSIKLMGEAEHTATVLARKERERQGRADARICVCECCGEVFDRKDSRMAYCSRTCANRHRMEKVTETVRKCAVCNKPFATKASIYCRNSCRNRAYKARKAAAAEPRPCENCGTIFKSHRPEMRFCNLVCAAAGNHARLPELSCRGCKAIFRARGPFDKRAYCSPNCSPGKAASAFQCQEVKS